MSETPQPVQPEPDEHPDREPAQRPDEEREPDREREQEDAPRTPETEPA